MESDAAEAPPTSSDLRPSEKSETEVCPDVVMIVFLILSREGLGGEPEKRPFTGNGISMAVPWALPRRAESG